MSKINEVTEFMKNDIAEMHKQADEVFAVAQQTKEEFNKAIEIARAKLAETQKDLLDLQEAMKVPSES